MIGLSLPLTSSQDAAPRWRPIPIVSARLRADGFPGGEGGQWPRALAVAPDGKTVYLGIDVGGIYRSLDGGKSWTPANVGYSPRGAVALAVDPNFPNRVLAVGGNSSPGAHHGVYLSTNSGASWRSVLPVNMAGLQEIREQLAFDPRSKGPDRTRRVYWSRIRGDKANWGTPEEAPAIYRSDDGGETWTALPDSAPYAGGILRVDPRDGSLLTTTAEGIFRSRDGGEKWRRERSENATGLDVAPDGTLVFSTADTVFVRGPKDANFRPSTIPDRNGTIRNVKLSPLDPRRIVLWTEGENWDWRRYATDDGGKTWTRAEKSSRGAMLPDNARQGIFAWSSTDAKRLWSIGGDWPTLSTDGGRSYAYSASGFSGLLIGGAFHFNPRRPNRVFVGSQDYDGAMTDDGGETWTRLSPSGNAWGGFTYGAFALSSGALVVGKGEGWGGPRTLRISEDDGQTWRDAGKLEGSETSLEDPDRPAVAFAYGSRSTDAGRTWTRMTGCDGVYTAAAGKLYGFGRIGNARSLVVSADHGASWRPLAPAPDDAQDVAVSPDGATVFVAAMRLLRLESGRLAPVETPADQFGNRTIRSVAFDPSNGRLAYAAGAANVYSSSVAALRSTDGGKTWSGLNLTAAPKAGELDGGREATWVRVQPGTGRPWFATSCYGLWTLEW